MKTLVRFASNAIGGVHYDPNPKAEYKVINQIYGSGFFVGGFPAGVRPLRAIGRVTLKALDPLKARVALRMAPKAVD